MTIPFRAIITIIAPAALAVFLGVSFAAPAARAFAEQTDRWTYDIDKEDAELGDYSGWNAGAGDADFRHGYDFGWTLGSGRSAGNGDTGAKTPADTGRSEPLLPVDAPESRSDR